MFDYLKGAIAHKTATAVVLDVGGVGYRVKVSLQTFAAIDGKESVKLYIHYHVNGQDYIPTLFGFATTVEREVFLLLTSVQGVGTNTARIILSSIKPDELAAAITQDREDVFKSIKGVGPKTAKRIILDLKDKILKVLGGDIANNVELGAPASENTARAAALQALQALGYSKIPAQRALNKVTKAQPQLDTDGELVRAALLELQK
ncbi:MAG: Holliday junction branch migration protein RuvA [Saprospiraceae bacterium]